MGLEGRSLLDGRVGGAHEGDEEVDEDDVGEELVDGVHDH